MIEDEQVPNVLPERTTIDLVISIVMISLMLVACGWGISAIIQNDREREHKADSIHQSNMRALDLLQRNADTLLQQSRTLDSLLKKINRIDSLQKKNWILEGISQGAVHY